MPQSWSELRRAEPEILLAATRDVAAFTRRPNLERQAAQNVTADRDDLCDLP